MPAFSYPRHVALAFLLATGGPLAVQADAGPVAGSGDGAARHEASMTGERATRGVGRRAPPGLWKAAKRKSQGGSGPTFTLAPSRVTLVEGSAQGAEVALEIVRGGGKSRPVTLTLSSDDAVDGEAIEHVFSPATLSSRESRATLSLKLPIAMAPRLPHERTLRVRADDGRAAVETTLTVAVEPVDAPDVYLLIGQSNMEGYSEIGSKLAGPGEPDEPVERVRQLHVRANNANAFALAEDFTDEAKNVASPLFIAAEDPLHDQVWYGQPKSGTFVGPGLSFGKAALARTSRTVYLVPAAWGATGFCANSMGDIAWNAEPYPAEGLGGTLLLDRALTRLDMTLRETGGVLRGILWHQGGGDANDPRCVASHADNLVSMVRRLRREARVDPRGPEARGDEAPIPFVLATQSKGSDERDNYLFGGGRQAIDDVHRMIGSLLPWADFINNDDLVPPAYPCGQGSCVHFGAAAMREQGRRFDAALQRIR